MRMLLFSALLFVVFSIASCGGSATGHGMSAADSLRLQDSLDALQQAEKEALEILQAEQAAIQAAEEAAKAVK